MIKILVDGLSAQIGGISTTIFNLLKNINREEYSVTFLLTYDSYYTKTIKECNFNYIKIIPFGKNPILYAWQLYNHFKLQKYDYIWINNTSKVNLLLPLLAKTINKSKIIWHAHGVDCEYSGYKKRIVKILECFNELYFYKLVDAYIACSKAVASCCYKNIGTKHINIIYNPIDVKKFLFNYSARKEIRIKYNIPDDYIVVGTIGRITYVKNQELMLRISALINGKYCFYIVGDGEDKTKLIKLANMLNVKIIFCGNVSNPNDYLQMFDIFILPSIMEGMPLALIEAQAAGLPCLVSDSITKEVDITGNVSFLNINNLSDWKNAITKIEINSNETRYQIGKTLLYSEYDISVTAYKFFKLFKCN